MSQLSRRSFIRGVAAMPVALWLASRGALADTPFIRYDIATPEGAAMLQIYAEAVAKMQALGPGDPSSWTWAWYTHFVDGLTTKDSEIARVFGDVASPARDLAVEMWNTCQAHSGQNPNNFLPWHRMYVLFMENIIRQVSGHPEFTMPYWNYTSYDPALRGIVPLQFRMPTDPVYGVLYRANRTKLANTGQSIQAKNAVDVLDLGPAMAKTSYSNVGKVQGFCRALDAGVHSRLHVLTGTAKNMGSVPYAGRDPLFLVHHANIDRIWASWNANGGPNPSNGGWMQQQFVFADPLGQRVSSKLSDYFDMAALGYGYDALIPPAAAPMLAKGTTGTTAAVRNGGQVVTEEVARAGNGAELGTRPAHIRLLPVAGTKRTEVLGLAPAQQGKRSYIVVRNLHVWVQPEVLYDLYLAPPGPNATPTRDNYIGTIDFFDAEFHDHGHGRMGEALGENLYSFEVTRLLERIARTGNPGARDELQLIVVPAGAPNPKARPMVGTIELVRQ